jgi:hypothetical protein
MRNHEQDNSSIAITRFVGDHDLADNNNVVEYRGSIRFEHSQGQVDQYVADIQITRDGSEFRVKLLDGIPDKFPYKFSDHFDEVQYDAYGPLRISGDYQHTKLGKYTAYIYPQII